jgi:uncharacterized protein with NRDE domain
MCTLIVLHRCFEAAPLVVAANRDEYFDRPAEGPALRETARGTVVAPRDERAGGTWLGLNEYGLFAAITNRRCESPDPNRRSRGLIVMDALGARSALEAVSEIESLDTDAYNPFNLLVADAKTAHVVSYAGSSERIDLDPGAHVIGNVHPADTSFPKVARQRSDVGAVREVSMEGALDSLAELCRSHAGNGPLEHTCVHADPYGTRSSTLLRLGPAGSRLLYADGPPCRSEYRDYTRLLTGLDLGSPGQTAHPSMRKVS